MRHSLPFPETPLSRSLNTAKIAQLFYGAIPILTAFYTGILCQCHSISMPGIGIEKDLFS
jgi:hypothetical protein